MSQPKNNKLSPTAKKNKWIDKLLEDNRFRVIASVAIALFSWMYVTMFVQPNTTQKITGVPVDFTYGALTYTQQGLSIVNDPEYYVTIVAYGDGSVLGNLDKDDFTVSPDYSSVKGSGEASLRLNVKCNANAGNVQVELENQSLRVGVVFDTVGDLTLPITVQLQDIALQDDFIINKAVALPAQVTLTGPTSELSHVKKAVAQVTADAPLSETVAINAPLHFYDEEGREVQFTYVSSDVQIAEVDIQVYKLAELPVSINFINTPPGFDTAMLKYSLSQEMLTVAGPAKLVDKMTDVNVGTIDLSTFTLDRVYEMPLSLPDGIVSQENVQQITVSFDSVGLATKTLNLPAESVEVVNLPNGYQLDVVSERIMNVTLCGPQEVLDALTVQGVVARIDAEDLSLVIGQQNIAVGIYVPSSTQVFAIGSYTVQCRITSE